MFDYREPFDGSTQGPRNRDIGARVDLLKPELDTQTGKPDNINKKSNGVNSRRKGLKQYRRPDTHTYPPQPP